MATADLGRFNPNHVPSGPGGGQFTSGGGGGGKGKAAGKPAPKAAHTGGGGAAAKAPAGDHKAAMKAELLAKAHAARQQARELEKELHGLEQQEKTAHAAAKKAAAHAAAAKKAGHVVHHHHHHAQHKHHHQHAHTLKQRITALKAKIRGLRERAASLEKQANAIRSVVTAARSDMSYQVAKSAKCPLSKPWAVIGGGGKVIGCHADQGAAQVQADGLQANDPAGAMTALSADPGGDERGPKPYGNVAYADPKNGKYPIDTAAHAKAALAYISMPKNAAKYPLNGVTLASVKARIVAACKKFGVTVSQSNAAHWVPDVDVVRSGETLELRSDAPPEGSLGVLTGRFSEFGRWYKVSSRFEGDFLEQVKRGATLDTIRDNRDQMRVLFDHGMDAQIGNKVLGPISELSERSDGPYYEVPLFDTSYNRDLLPGLKAGVYGASMRMRVTGDEWNDEPDPSDSNPDGLPERSITRMKVLEFGPVTFPANPGASAGVRSGTDEFYTRLQAVDAPAFEDAVRAAGLSPADFTGRGGGRRGGGNDVQPGNGRPSPNPKTALRDRAWRMRRQP